MGLAVQKTWNMSSISRWSAPRSSRLHSCCVAAVKAVTVTRKQAAASVASTGTIAPARGWGELPWGRGGAGGCPSCRPRTPPPPQIAGCGQAHRIVSEASSPPVHATPTPTARHGARATPPTRTALQYTNSRTVVLHSSTCQHKLGLVDHAVVVVVDRFVELARGRHDRPEHGPPVLLVLERVPEDVLVRLERGQDACYSKTVTSTRSNSISFTAQHDGNKSPFNLFVKWPSIRFRSVPRTHHAPPCGHSVRAVKANEIKESSHKSPPTRVALHLSY